MAALPAGMRMTRKRRAMTAEQLKKEIALFTGNKLKNIVVEEPVSRETDAEISGRIAERFEILSELTDASIKGEARALIVSGPAGLGKSFTVEKALETWDPGRRNHCIIKGNVKTTGLYKLLWQYKNKGQVIVFDDADTVFLDELSLSLLKAVCDTNDRRVVSYLGEGQLYDEEFGTGKIPKSFEFEGSIVFITNLDFDAMIEKGNKLAPHLQAMVSRAHYIDLSMKTKRDYLIRIRQVVEQGLLKDRGLTDEMQKEVVKFIMDHSDKLRELSLRIALKIASIRKTNPTRWQNVSRVTCCRS